KHGSAANMPLTRPERGSGAKRKPHGQRHAVCVSGRSDLNRRPHRPERCALSELRHAPCLDAVCETSGLHTERLSMVAYNVVVTKPHSEWKYTAGVPS